MKYLSVFLVGTILQNNQSTQVNKGQLMAHKCRRQDKISRQQFGTPKEISDSENYHPSSYITLNERLMKKWIFTCYKYQPTDNLLLTRWGHVIV